MVKHEEDFLPPEELSSRGGDSEQVITSLSQRTLNHIAEMQAAQCHDSFARHATRSEGIDDAIQRSGEHEDAMTRTDSVD